MRTKAQSAHFSNGQTKAAAMEIRKRRDGRELMLTVRAK